MCVLHASGYGFNVDKFMTKSRLRPYSVFHRGDPVVASNTKRKYNDSGLKIAVSDASWSDLPAQVADVTRFLKRNQKELARLACFPGVKLFCLDFPIDLRIGKRNVAIQGESFPATLVRAAGGLNLELWFTIYPK